MVGQGIASGGDGGKLASHAAKELFEFGSPFGGQLASHQFPAQRITGAFGMTNEMMKAQPVGLEFTGNPSIARRILTPGCHVTNPGVAGLG